MNIKKCFYCESKKDLIFDSFGMIYICKKCKDDQNETNL